MQVEGQQKEKGKERATGEAVGVAERRGKGKDEGMFWSRLCSFILLFFQSYMNTGV